MGIGSKVGKFANSVQEGVKTSSSSLFNWSLKIATAFFVGFTVALIGQEIMGFGSFSFFMMMLVMMGLILRLSAKWTVGGILLFDLICVLVALLLRMYLIIAP